LEENIVGLAALEGHEEDGTDPAPYYWAPESLLSEWK
jgi:hypothetical protein